MQCRAFDSTEAFLSRTATFFQGREAENTILLGAVRAMGEAPATGDLLMAVTAAGSIWSTHRPKSAPRAMPRLVSAP